MTTLNHNTIVSLLCATALLVTAGCGDETSIEESGAPPEVGQTEFAILSADTQLAYINTEHVVEVDTSADQDVLMLAALNEELSISEPEDFGDRIDLTIDALPDAPPVAAQLSLENQGPVCAGVDTWKELSHKTCDMMGGWLSAVSLSTNAAASTSAPTFFNVLSTATTARKSPLEFQSFTLGGRSTCKPYAAFADYAAEICGGSQNLREKHILGACDRFGSEDGFSAIRFTCEV